jgi:hypothetical protein
MNGLTLELDLPRLALCLGDFPPVSLSTLSNALSADGAREPPEGRAGAPAEA